MHSKTALAWCNEEDHCRIISMSTDGNVKAVFACFCMLSEAVKKAATDAGAELMHNDSLGFMAIRAQAGVDTSCVMCWVHRASTYQSTERC